MSKSDSITRHHLIIKKIRKRPLSYSNLLNYLELESELQEYDFIVSQRTFQRDLNDIRKIYKIDIQYDRSKGVYEINEEYNQGTNERMFEAYEIFNILNLSDRLSQNIHFDNRKPDGIEHLHGLLHAIKNKVQIEFTYFKYDTQEFRAPQVQPYALKEHRSRWYLIGYDFMKEEVRIFGLDRLSALKISNKAFTHHEDFNVNSYFQDCFGIIRANAKQAEEVILSFTAHQGQYIKSMPLHQSQKILIDSEKELRIRLKLFITYDLEIELRSFGANMKVIEPKRLVNQIKKSFKQALKQYEEP
jgi:predicted DNA-binding transcriptional regulator YafY